MPRPLDAWPVRLVVGEQRGAAEVCVEVPAADAVGDRDRGEGLDGGVIGLDQQVGLLGLRERDRRLVPTPGAPAPGVAEPEVGEDVQRRGVGASIVGLDLDAEVFRCRLGVLDEDVEIAVLFEDARIEQLEFEVMRAASAVLLHEPTVGEFPLRVLVEELHVRVRRRIVEVEVIFLDVLAVIALRRRQAEEAFLEDRVLAVPEGGGEAEELIAVADAGDAVLAPAVGLAAGEVVGEVAPGVAVGGIVLADGRPCAVADVGPPPPPAGDVVLDLAETLVLVGLGHHRLPNLAALSLDHLVGRAGLTRRCGRRSGPSRSAGRGG